jgi:uncharacterized protein (TIGR03086 family)
MADLRALFAKATGIYGEAVHQIRDEQWHDPTPCTDWDVRALLHHLVYEMVWVRPMLEGKTIAEVGDTFEGDVLGDDPIASWDKAAADALAVLENLSSLQSVTHLSFGDFPAEEYLNQVLFDLHIHNWDLRNGINVDTTLDDELTEYLFPWAEPAMNAYRAAGVVAPAPEVTADASRQTQILALSGRRA